MKIKYNNYKLKDEAFPELLPESRVKLNNDISEACKINVACGYVQGVGNTLIGIGLATIAVGTGVTIGKLIIAKKKSKQPKKKD